MIASRFGMGREGWTSWTVTGFDSGIEEPAKYSRKYDFISIGPGGGDEYLRAGPEWNGDLSAYFGARLSFRLRQDGENGFFSTVGVFIQGTNGIRIQTFLTKPDDRDWHYHSVAIDQFSDWRTSLGGGGLADEATILSVLGSVDSIMIRGADRYGDTRTDLDDVTLMAKPRSRVALVESDEVFSNFNHSGENWSFFGDVKAFKQVDTGGVHGGFLKAVDNLSGTTMFFTAPDEFEGEKAGFFGGSLSFYMKDNGLGLPDSGSRAVIIRGANENWIQYSLETTPGKDWTRYDLRLDETGVWFFNSNFIRATDAQIQSIMEDILSIEIRGEYIYGPETVGLDNVRLSAPSGRFDILAQENSARLLATTDDFDVAIDVLTAGNVLHIGPGDPLDRIFAIDADDVTIHAGGQLSGRITLAEDVRKLVVIGAGERLDVVGNGLSNMLRISGSTTDLVKVDGKAGDDFIFAAADIQSGSVRLKGGLGNDTLRGGWSGDKLIGDRGQDVLDGNRGNDRLLGGKGADTFDFVGTAHGRDLIIDFGKGDDRIRLTNTGYSSFEELKFRDWHGNLAIDISARSLIALDGYTDPSQLSASDFLFTP